MLYSDTLDGASSMMGKNVRGAVSTATRAESQRAGEARGLHTAHPHDDGGRKPVTIGEEHIAGRYTEFVHPPFAPVGPPPRPVG